MINIVEKSHELLKQYNNPQVALDMTSGRGNDALFLAKIAKEVYAFDIQDVAIKSTLELLKSENIENVRVIKDNHRNVLKHVKSLVDIAIYNLGYLPHGDKSITTNPDDVIASLEALLGILSLGGIIVIVLYMHNSEEEKSLLEYTSTIPKNFDVWKYQVLNYHDCPYIIAIKKVQE